MATDLHSYFEVRDGGAAGGWRLVQAARVDDGGATVPRLESLHRLALAQLFHGRNYAEVGHMIWKSGIWKCGNVVD